MPANKFEIESIFTGVDRLSRPLDKMGRSLHDFQRKASKNLGSARQSFNNMAIASKGAALAIAGAGIGAVTLMAKIAKKGATFEQTIVDAATKMPDKLSDITKTMALLSAEAQKVGEATTISATKAAQGLLRLGQAGFTTQQSISSLMSVVDLAKATNSEFELTSRVMATSLNAFGLKSKDPIKLTENLNRVINILALTTRSADVELGDILETIAAGGPDMAAAGVSFSEFNALLANMGASAIKGGKAGTTLKNLSGKLVKPVGLAAKMIDELGIRLDESEAKMTKPIDALAMLEKGFARLNITGRKRLAIIKEIFQEEGKTGVLALLSVGTSKIRAQMAENEAAVAKNTVSVLAKIQRNTLAGSFLQLQSAIEGVEISFAEANKGGLKDFIDKSTDWVRNHQPELISGLDAVANTIRAVGLAAQTTGRLYRDMTKFLSDSTPIKIIAEYLNQREKETGKDLGLATLLVAPQFQDFSKVGSSKSNRLPPAFGAGANLLSPDFHEFFFGRKQKVMKAEPVEKSLIPKSSAGSTFLRFITSALKGTSTFGASPNLSPVLNPEQFSPVDASGGSAIVGDGRTSTSIQEKTSKVILELPPGVKARTEGDENPDVQITPTGGL